MPPLLKFIFRRLLTVPVTLLLITALLYGIIMLAPVETRARIYLSRGNSNNPNLNEEAQIRIIIERYGLQDPYPIQYARWAARLLSGDWGWSPIINQDVLPALLQHTPPTAELTLYSILLLVPLGLFSGGYAGWKEGRPADAVFRVLAFIATSIPPFILGLMLLAVFYVGVRWFPPGRIDLSSDVILSSSTFRTYTGLLTVDGLLNNRLDVTVDALRHLVLPAFTLSLTHWATLGRVTRVAMATELEKDYIRAAHGRGLPQRAVIWRHALRNAMLPALNSAALSAASLVMGVFVVEAVFQFPGISELMVSSMAFTPDTPMALGMAIYSVLLVLPLMLVFDLLQAIIDPRVREGVMES